MNNNWKSEIKELQIRQLLAEVMGGSDKVIQQKECGHCHKISLSQINP